MPGILVGIDGSAHSQLALEWAAKEAALRHTSLTVLTVHQAVAGFWGGTLHYAGDTFKIGAEVAAQVEAAFYGADGRGMVVTLEYLKNDGRAQAVFLFAPGIPMYVTTSDSS